VIWFLGLRSGRALSLIFVVVLFFERAWRIGCVVFWYGAMLLFPSVRLSGFRDRRWRSS
jgi:hypothetical protein